ncbi:MAG: hypothetical protein RR190_04620, partial [Bacteroidales bacterium]
MKRNLILLLSLIVVLVGFLIYRSFEEEGMQIPIHEIPSVSCIQITNFQIPKNEQISIEKKANKWYITPNIEADAEVFKNYLEVLSSLQLQNPQSKAKVKELQQNTNISKGQVVIYTRSFLGFKYPKRKIYFYQDSLHLYASKRKNGIVYVISTPLINLAESHYFSAQKEHWRSRRILHCPINQIARIHIAYPSAADSSFTIIQNGNSIRIQPMRNAPLDTLQIYDFLSSFTDIYANSFVNHNLSSLQRKQSFSKPSKQKIYLLNKQGFEIELDTYPKYNQEDSVQKLDPYLLYGVLPHTKDTVVLSYFILDKIQRS